MFDTKFQSGSLVHLLSLVGCALAVVGYAHLARRHRTGMFPQLPKILASACVLAWLTNTIAALTPTFFEWESSLPLYYCNWATLLGAAALVTPWRIIKSLLYYWACGLSIWAFVTPTLEFGPARIGFWIFWAYHLCIALAVCHLLVAQRFRPTLSDWFNGCAVTIAYGLLLVPINVYWGWNYAFLGQSSPQATTPIDALGSWPQRLLWLALLAAVLFLLLTLPWLRQRRHRPNK